MPTMSRDSILRRIKEGATPDEAVIEWLTQTGMQDFVSEVRPDFPFLFQERHIRRKWETGLARACQTRLRFRFPRRSVFPVAYLTPVFRDCLFIVGEDGHLTGLSVASHLAIRPAKNGFALSSGRGHNLFRDLGEWCVKPVNKKTTVLTEELLRKYGWRFDMPWFQQTLPGVSPVP